MVVWGLGCVFAYSFAPRPPPLPVLFKAPFSLAPSSGCLCRDEEDAQLRICKDQVSFLQTGA